MYSPSVFFRNVRGDIFGGLTAAIVALPLALAFGIASGAGPAAGLYGAAIVGLLATIFGGTPSQVSGPTGPMTVVMTAMIAQFMAAHPEHGMALAFTTVVLGGVFQFLFGALRLGKYIIMVPYPVISGFMTGIGVIIVLLQLGPLLGFAGVGDVLSAAKALPGQLTDPDLGALAVGSVALAVMFFWRGRLNRALPSPLLALVAATLASLWLVPGDGLSRIGDLPSGLPTFHPPHFETSVLQEMIVSALMLAVLGSIDSLLTALVADNITGTQHDSDRELMGQGIGNIGAGLFGGLPGAGATMRTVVNVRAGGSGPLSGVTHALVLLAVIAGLGRIFGSIPIAALAGILIKVGIDIIDWPFLRRMHRLPLFPVMLMLLVLVITVFVDLITAVFIGVFIKNLVTIEKLSDLELGSVILTDGTLDAERLPASDREMLSRQPGKTTLLRITGPVSYAVGRGLIRRSKSYGAQNRLLVDIANADLVGISTTMVLEDLIRSALADGSEVKLIGLHRSTRRERELLGLADLVGEANCVDSLAGALDTSSNEILGHNKPAGREDGGPCRT